MVARGSTCQKCGEEIWLDGKHKCDGTGFDDGKPKPIMLSDVKRLVINDGDTMVLYIKDKLKPEQYKTLNDAFQLNFASLWKERNIKTIILCNGMDIGVLANK